MTAKPLPFDLGRTLAEALARHREGRLDEAEKLYHRVLKAQRDNFDALHLLAMLNHQRGKAGEAYRLITAALEIAPRSPDALSNLGLILHALRRDDEALSAIDKALAIAPNHAEALNNRGTLLLELKRPAEAIAAFDAVLAISPRFVQGFINRGNARAELGRPDLAMADYDAALAIAPGHPLAHYNRGNALHALSRDREAIADYDRTLAVLPHHVNALLNRGLALAALNRHGEAIASYERVLALESDHAEAHFNAALSRLTLGDYRGGFAEYEWRWRRAGIAVRKDLRKPRWSGGESLAGKTVLLHAEQGLGDTVMFARYAPLVAASGANVILEVQPALKPLFAGFDGVAATVARGEPLPPFDLHCPLGSLPLAFGTEPAGIPAKIPYLRAPAERFPRWERRLASLPSPRVAVAWSGRASHANDRNRSIALGRFRDVFASSRATFIGVQTELRQAELEILAGEPRLTPLGSEFGDFADTAVVLSLCDLVVSVDTSIAHVAAALGRPTAVLLPFQPDWRWTLDRPASPWYPAAKLYRQPAPGDWDAVLAALRGEIERLG